MEVYKILMMSFSSLFVFSAVLIPNLLYLIALVINTIAPLKDEK